MTLKKQQLLILDDDNQFSKSIQNYCVIQGWTSETYNKWPTDFNIFSNKKFDWIFLDWTLIPTKTTQADKKNNIENCISKIKTLRKHTNPAKIIICAQEFNIDYLLEELKIYNEKEKLVWDIAEKPYDLRQLSPVLTQEEKIEIPPETIVRNAAYRLPVALAIFDLMAREPEEKLWCNNLWEESILTTADKRIFRVMMATLRMSSKNTSYEFLFPYTISNNISVMARWHLWVVKTKEKKYIWIAHEQSGQYTKNTAFSYLEKETDLIKRFQEITQGLAILHAISRFRLYEINLLPEHYNKDTKRNYLRKPLMIPRFISGGGVIDKNEDFSSTAWFENEFLLDEPVGSPIITKKAYTLTAVKDEERSQQSKTQTGNLGCPSLRWGNAGTRAQIHINENEQDQVKSFAKIAIDRRLDHLDQDRNHKQELRKALVNVIQAAPMAFDDPQLKLSSLSPEELDNMEPLFDELQAVVIRWLKRIRRRAQSVWHVIIGHFINCLLSNSSLSPNETLKYLLYGMAVAWPLTQGLRVPQRSAFNFIPKSFSTRSWGEAIQELHRLCTEPDDNETRKKCFDAYVANHCIKKGLNNLYICNQVQEGFFISLAGFGPLHELRGNKRQYIHEPHKTAFLKAKDRLWTVNQDFPSWAKKHKPDLFIQNDPGWCSALKEIGSWCAITISDGNQYQQIQSTLLIATSSHQYYFTETRLGLLKDLAERLTPIVSWHHEWSQSEKLRLSLAHGLGHHLADFNTFIHQENWEGIRSMQPLIQGFAKNFNFEIGSSDLVEQKHCLFEEPLNALQSLKNHPDYDWVLADWKYWQDHADKSLAISSSTLQHILYNLISNASRYAVEGTVSLGATIKNGDLVLHICNKGKIPLTEYDRKYILGMRFRPLDAPSNGTGLGLGIIKGLIEAHTGSIMLCNQECQNCNKLLSNTTYQYRFGLQLKIPLDKWENTNG